MSENEKALDKSVLVDILKGEGLDLAEDALTMVAKGSIKIIKAVVKATPNKFDDMLIPALDLAEPLLVEQIDKLDGEVG